MSFRTEFFTYRVTDSTFWDHGESSGHQVVETDGVRVTVERLS